MSAYQKSRSRLLQKSQLERRVDSELFRLANRRHTMWAIVAGALLFAVSCVLVGIVIGGNVA